MTVSAHVGDSPRESRHILGLFQMGKKKKNWRILHREAGAIWFLKRKKGKKERKNPARARFCEERLKRERERERKRYPDSEELERSPALANLAI